MGRHANDGDGNMAVLGRGVEGSVVWVRAIVMDIVVCVSELRGWKAGGQIEGRHWGYRRRKGGVRAPFQRRRRVEPIAESDKMGVVDTGAADVLRSGRAIVDQRWGNRRTSFP